MKGLSEQFLANAHSWGKQGDEWVKNLPELIEHYEQEWDIKALAPFQLSYNYVAPVKCADGTEAVLKIGFPKDTELQTELSALEVFDGIGCAPLLKMDRVNTTVLLERVSPGNPLSELTDDVEATRVIASVIKKLHKPLPPNHHFITVDKWAKDLAKYKTKYGLSGPMPAKLVDKAEDLFKHLVSTSAEPVLVHGDLHHDNVLKSEEHGWIAIDPKGIAAEPMYEVAAMIRNPYPKLKEIKDLSTLLSNRIAILSEELGFDTKRMLQWCLAQTVLSAVWSVEGVKGHEHALRVAEVLDTLSV